VCRSAANDDYKGANRWGFRCGYLTGFGGTNGTDTTTSTVCPGDSGGPVYIRSGSNVIAVGVTVGGADGTDGGSVQELPSEGSTFKGCFSGLTYEPLGAAIRRLNDQNHMALTVTGDA
jgi:hypothetical protein